MGYVSNLAGTGGVGSVPQVGTGSTLLPCGVGGSHSMKFEAEGSHANSLKKD